MWRGKFAFQVVGESPVSIELAGSEWLLFQRLRRIAHGGGQLEWFESHGAPLVPASLAALNCYIELGGLRHWRSKRRDQADGRELIGPGEWTRFCRMLGLRFDGRRTRAA